MVRTCHSSVSLYNAHRPAIWGMVYRPFFGLRKEWEITEPCNAHGLVVFHSFLYISILETLTLLSKESTALLGSGCNYAVMARRVAIYRNPSGSRTDLTGKNAHLMTPTSTNAFVFGRRFHPFSSCAHLRVAAHKILAVCMKRDPFSKCLPTQIRRPNPNDR